MTASLIVAGYELYDDTADPQFQLSGIGWNRGDALPDQATVENHYLDGEAITGSRTRNRNPRIPFWVRGINTLDLAAQANLIRQALDQDSFTIQWTPDGGLPVVYDCFRGSVTGPQNIYLEQNSVKALLLDCQAKPFGRSPAQQSISAAASLQIDSFDTVATGATRDTTHKFEGTASAAFALTQSGSQYTNATPVSRTFAAKNLSAYTGLSLRLRADYPGSAPATVTVTLGSTSGSTRYTGSISTGGNVAFRLVDLSFTSGVAVSGSGVDLTAVTSESITVTVTPYLPYGSTTINANVDDLRAVAGSATLLSTTRGEVLAMPAVIGSARTPVSLVLSGTSMAAALLHTPPADQDSNAQILMALSNSSHTLVTVPVSGSTYDGTYAIWLSSISGGPGAGVITVTVTQKVNGTTVATQVITSNYDSSDNVTGALVAVGDVTLPLRAVPGDNSTTSYTFDVQAGGAGVYIYSDLMLCDVRGQTVAVAPATAAPLVYVDEPDPTRSDPNVYAAATGRSDAYAVMDTLDLRGGPIQLEPGSNKILAWAADTAAPTVIATYYPRWLDDRAV